MLLLSTSSLKGYGLHKIFTFAKKAGYDGLDLVMDGLNYDTLDANYIKSLSDAFEVPVLSITAPEKGMNEKKVDEVIKMAMLLKSQIITFTPPHLSDKNTTWFFKYLAKVKRENRISIAVQNVEPKFYLYLIPEYKSNTLMEIKRITGDSTLNISNINVSTGTDLSKAHKILGNTIRNILFSDRYGSREGMLPGGSGGGVSHLPLESFLMKLRTSAYSGFITLKVRPSELEVGNDEKVMQNLDYMKNYYKKHYLDYKGVK